MCVIWARSGGRVLITSSGGKVSVQDSAAGRRPFAPRPSKGPEGARETQRLSSAARLARGLRWLMGPRQRRCRLNRVSPSVQLAEYSGEQGERLHLVGVETCKCPLCVFCAAKWARTRTEEVGRAIEGWGAARVAFVTLTMPHHRGMRLALMSRLLRDAHGHLWSGRAGQDATLSLGGKPETIRAQDRTWSDERGFHPHLHALFFLPREGTSDDDLREVLNDRWPASLRSSLRRFKRTCKRLLGGTARCREVACPFCRKLEHGECPNLRERATRVFGVRLVPRRLPLLESVRKISQALEHFSEAWMFPEQGRRADAWAHYRVHVERVRDPERASEYITKLIPQKLGLELAGVGKLGKTGSDGIRHYGLWELAELCVRPEGPEHPTALRKAARAAWKELYWSTAGTQQITFSSRDRLGLGEDPYANGGEPDEQGEGETVRGIGAIVGQVWDELRREKEHGLLIELDIAHQRGVIAAVPYVNELAPIHGDPRHRVPPATGPPPEERERRRAERLLEAERRGAAVFGGALRKAQAPTADRSLFVEEMRYRLNQILGTSDRRVRRHAKGANG